MITRRDAFRLGGSTLAAFVGTASLLGACQLTLVPAAEPDPMLVLIERYRAAMEIYNASGDLTTEEDDELAEATYLEPWRELRDSPPIVTSEAGALAALRLAAEEMEDLHGSFELPLLRAALAYFDGRA